MLLSSRIPEMPWYDKAFVFGMSFKECMGLLALMVMIALIVVAVVVVLNHPDIQVEDGISDEKAKGRAGNGGPEHMKQIDEKMATKAAAEQIRQNTYEGLTRRR